MGCMVSTPRNRGGSSRWSWTAAEVAVFVPGLRIPKSVELSQPLGYILSRNSVEHLSALRTCIVVMAAQEARTLTKPRWKTATQHGVSSLADLLQALEDYLPVLLGLVKIENRRTSIDIFLKAAGYLDCAIGHVLPQFPPETRKHLSLDLAEGVLRVLCMQALAQSVDIQLGMAIDSPKATLAVKRRLACEMVKCWHEAQDSIRQVPLTDGWGRKHCLFIKWKYAEAKAAAYYYHGLILDEGNTEKSHVMAIAALQAAKEFLKESKTACGVFNALHPTSTNPPLWGSAKYLSEKIPKDASSKVCINCDLYNHERVLRTAPTLPDFAVALKPDDYQLPPLDSSWNEQDCHQQKAEIILSCHIGKVPFDLYHHSMPTYEWGCHFLPATECDIYVYITICCLLFKNSLVASGTVLCTVFCIERKM